MSTEPGMVIEYERLDGTKTEGAVWSAAPGGAYWVVPLKPPRYYVKVRSRPNSTIYKEVMPGRKAS